MGIGTVGAIGTWGQGEWEMRESGYVPMSLCPYVPMSPCPYALMSPSAE
jgi:hypothetical protein